MPAAGRRCSAARCSPSHRSHCSSTSPILSYGTSLALLLGGRHRQRRGRGGQARAGRPSSQGSAGGWRPSPGPTTPPSWASPWRRRRASVLAPPASGRWQRLGPLVGLAALGAVGPLLASLAFNHAMTGDALQLPFRILEPRDGPGLGLRRSLPTDGFVDYTWDRAASSFGRNLLLVSAWGAGGLLGACLAVATLVRRRLARRAADRRGARRLAGGLRALLGLLRRRVPVGRGPVPGALLLPPDRGDAGDPRRRRAGRPLALAGAGGGGRRARRGGPDVRRGGPEAGRAARSERAPDCRSPRWWRARSTGRPSSSSSRAYGPFLQNPLSFLRNRPGLDGPVLYAVDRGEAINRRVQAAHPERRAYRLVLPAGWNDQPGFDPQARVEELPRPAP